MAGRSMVVSLGGQPTRRPPALRGGGSRCGLDENRGRWFFGGETTHGASALM